MRELKFRAYLKKEEEMYEVFSFCDKFIKVIVGLGTAWKLDINEFEPIMQFTGLKDKNGVDIYEGDILKGKENIYINGYSSNVYFLEGSFCISLEYDCVPIPLHECETVYQCKIKNKVHEEIMELYNEYINKTSELIDFEVIGNIHENKELLNK